MGWIERGKPAGRDEGDVVGWAVLFYAPSCKNPVFIGRILTPLLKSHPSPASDDHLDKFPVTSQSLQRIEQFMRAWHRLNTSYLKIKTKSFFSCHIT